MGIIARLTGPGQTFVSNNVFDQALSIPLDSPDSSVTSVRNVHPFITGDNLAAAPAFADASNGDYRLAAGSPGIDAGDLSAYLAAGGGFGDINGVFRGLDDPAVTNTGPGGSVIDAGAFEFEVASDATPNPCPADLALPVGVLDISDIDAFISSFLAGCP